MLEKLLKNKLKNMDEEILKLLKEKISISLTLEDPVYHNDLTVRLFYKDDKGEQHQITSAHVLLPITLG